MHSTSKQRLAWAGAGLLGLSLALLNPLESRASRGCAQLEALSANFDAKPCAHEASLDGELRCIIGTLASMPAWRCRTEPEREWHGAAALQAHSAAAFVASDPSLDGERASQQMSKAVLTALVGLESSSDDASGACSAASSALDYGCLRAQCAGEAGLSPLFTDASKAQGEVCPEAERQCDDASEAPADCSALEAARKRLSAGPRLIYATLQANEHPDTQGDADYQAQKAVHRQKLAELALAVEAAGRSEDAKAQVDALLEAHYAEVTLPSIASAAQATSKVYATYSAAGAPGAEQKVKALERLVGGLPDCSKKCERKLVNASTAYAKLLTPERANDWMIKVRGELVSGAQFLASQEP